MGHIHYDPERILNGFTEDSLKELAKKLKRKARVIKRDIIQDVLSPPKDKSVNIIKVWQEINWQLRKELERFSEQEKFADFSFQETPIEEQFKIGYMLTLSPNPETRAMGETLYGQAYKNYELEDESMSAEVIEAVTEEILEDIKSDNTKQEIKELQKRIKTLETMLRKANIEGLRDKGHLERLKTEIATLNSQAIQDKEEIEKFQNKVRELEWERDQEVLNCEIDLSNYQGRKALIFAERDDEVEVKLSTLGIIPIWAMGIDWNRPRRRMSTCHVVLYKSNSENQKKLEEIQSVAKYWNIPCHELLQSQGRNVRDKR